jgi:hypothetical protein
MDDLDAYTALPGLVEIGVGAVLIRVKARRAAF